MDKIELIKSMIDLNQKNAQLWYLLGIEYAQAENADNAVSAFTKALKYCDNELKDNIVSELEKLELLKGRRAAAEMKSEGQENDKNNRNDKTETDESESVGTEVIPFQVINGGKSTDTDNHESITFDDVGGLS